MVVPEPSRPDGHALHCSHPARVVGRHVATGPSPCCMRLCEAPPAHPQHEGVVAACGVTSGRVDEPSTLGSQSAEDEAGDGSVDLALAIGKGSMRPIRPQQALRRGGCQPDAVEHSGPGGASAELPRRHDHCGKWLMMVGGCSAHEHRSKWSAIAWVARRPHLAEQIDRRSSLAQSKIGRRCFT